MRLKKLSKEPLVHFLLAGLFLFLFFEMTGKKNANDPLSNTIKINQEILLNYLQFQSKAFNQTVFSEKLAQFSETEKQQLIDNYIKEEVLYREAVRLGLDQNDFVIKRRIIQKMEFILDDFEEATATVLPDSLSAYYHRHTHRYFRPEQYSFTHIFFKKKDNQSAVGRARKFMQNKAHQNLSATESLRFGDRFLYHRNYAEKTKNFLESQFGMDFVTSLSALPADKKKWQGPIPSAHGQHWVLLIEKTEATTPPLSEVKAVVKADYLGYLKRQHLQAQIEQLISNYEVEVD